MNYNEEKKKERRIFWGLLLTGIIGFCLLLWIFNFSTIPLRISPETTFVTEPLTKDGKSVDYFAALEKFCYPAEMKTDENGFRIFVRHVGPGTETRGHALSVSQLYEKLGLDPNEKPTLSFKSGSAFVEEYAKKLFSGAEPETRRFREGYWTAEELELIRPWVLANSPVLDLLGECVQKKAFGVPMIDDEFVRETGSIFSVLLPEIQSVREYARSLAIRAKFRVQTGDIDGAIDDIITCHRLGRHVGDGILVCSLVGIALEGIALAIPLNNANTEQLKRLQSGLRNSPTRFPFESSLRCERFGFLSAIQGIANGKLSPKAYDTPILFALKFCPDWNVIFKGINKSYDEMEARTYVYYPMSWHPIEAVKLLVSRQSRSIILEKIAEETFLPADQAALEAHNRADCYHNMKELALAMLLYERQHGTLPPAFSVDSDGKPLHSWRVHILPFLCDPAAQEIYDNIRLDESWDSEHNKAFHKADLSVFRCPSSFSRSSVAAGETTYSVIVGENCLFNANGTGSTSDRLHALLLTEKGNAVCWMNPNEDVTQSEAESGIGKTIGSRHSGGVNAVFLSGAVRFLSNTIPLEQIPSILDGSIEMLP